MITTRLNLTHRQAFLQMLADYAALDPENGKLYVRGREDFPAYVHRLADDEEGVNLPSGVVPCSHRWLLDDAGAIVGVVRVRHNIGTRFLAEEIGHIGYDVPPSFRGKGHGIACLTTGLEIARTLGLERVLLCADTDNPASWRTIEHCSGILEAERFSPHYKKLFRRYWIEIGIGYS
ncbi:MAG: GNAT family N-acetyltransferase [Anaerolineales bacterium]|jgi:predicted acetyltransferase